MGSINMHHYESDWIHRTTLISLHSKFTFWTENWPAKFKQFASDNVMQTQVPQYRLFRWIMGLMGSIWTSISNHACCPRFLGVSNAFGLKYRPIYSSKCIVISSSGIYLPLPHLVHFLRTEVHRASTNSSATICMGPGVMPSPLWICPSSTRLT